MARLPYNIWATRKRKTANEIVEQGVLNLAQLDEFLSDRGVALPLDLSEFEKIWLASIPKVAKDVKKEAAKKPAKAVSKPAKTTPKPARSTRRKSSIKDNNNK